MSLRTRLVLTVVSLLVLGLLLSVGATFGALQDWRARQSDDLLSVAGRQIEDQLATGSADPAQPAGTLRAAVGDVGALWRALAESGDGPAFFQVRDASGRVQETVAFGPGPRLPDILAEEFLPVTASSENPSGQRFSRVTGFDSSDGDEPVYWRLRSSTIRATDQVLLVAQRSIVSDELISRTANVAIITSASVLVGLTLLSGYLVRRGLRPLEAIGSTAAAIGSGDLSRRIEDTTERTEIGRLGQSLNAMLGQIEHAFHERERSEERLRRFVADASHELRTPIATVRGYAELFRRGAALRPADLADAMRRIEVEATRMGELVDELLLLARLDQGLPLEREPVDLAALVEEAVSQARALEPDRPIEVAIEGETVVTGDRERLRQVMTNLLGNVRAHTPTGAPAIVRVTGTSDAVELEVADHGPGLPEPDRQRVFERFYQAGNDRTRGGAGLGLAIVAAVVGAHDGTATVFPDAGGGCRFQIRIPSADTGAGRNRARSQDPGPEKLTEADQ